MLLKVVISFYGIKIELKFIKVVVLKVVYPDSWENYLLFSFGAIQTKSNKVFRFPTYSVCCVITFVCSVLTEFAL